MPPILSTLAVPFFGFLAFLIGKIQGRKKNYAELKKVEIDNLESVVDFYKQTFDELKGQLKVVSLRCQELSEEITTLRKENISLKNEIHLLNQRLNNYEK